MKKTALLAIVLLAIKTAAHAVPVEINYQGVLTDQAGNPINGVRAIQLKIYDAPTGGNITYTEDLGNVSVQDGIYSFSFGANGTSNPLTAPVSGITDAIIGSNQAWVETSINGVSQTPRQKILTVPYAMVAKKSEDAQLLNSSVSTLQTQTSGLSSNVTSIQGQVNGVSSNVTALSSNLTTLQSQSTSLTTSYGTLNSTVSGLSSNLTMLKTQSASSDDIKESLNLLLDLQNKLIQIQSNITSSTVPYNLISDVFSNQNGVNNTVQTVQTTAAYTSPSYNAGVILLDNSTYSLFTNWSSFLLLKSYSANYSVVQTSTEMALDTQCYIIYKYQDGSTAQTPTQSGSGNVNWVKRIFANPQKSKIVTSIEVWGSKPGGMVYNTTQLRNVEILKYQSVDIFIDLSSFSGEIKAAQLRVDGSRQDGDSITYEIKNSLVGNAGLELSRKNILASPIAQPAFLRITLSPTQIQNFVYGGTSVRAFSLMLW